MVWKVSIVLERATNVHLIDRFYWLGFHDSAPWQKRSVIDSKSSVEEKPLRHCFDGLRHNLEMLNRMTSKSKVEDQGSRCHKDDLCNSSVTNTAPQNNSDAVMSEIDHDEAHLIKHGCSIMKPLTLRITPEVAKKMTCNDIQSAMNSVQAEYNETWRKLERLQTEFDIIAKAKMKIIGGEHVAYELDVEDLLGLEYPNESPALCFSYDLDPLT